MGSPTEMKVPLQPISMSTTDFLAVLIPGFLWTYLLISTLLVATSSDSLRKTANSGAPKLDKSPIVATWSVIDTELSRPGRSWIANLFTILLPLIVGSTFKAISMRAAQASSKPFAWFKLRKHRNLRNKALEFPFRAYFMDTCSWLQEQADDIYRELLTHKSLGKRRFLHGDIGDYNLPGNPPFGGLKRYIQLTAPALGNQSQKMEAEVRLYGSLYLISLYSISLGIASLALYRWEEPALYVNIIWLSFSVAGALLLGEGFIKIRLREVGYTYVNAILVYRHLRDASDATT